MSDAPLWMLSLAGVGVVALVVIGFGLLMNLGFRLEAFIGKIRAYNQDEELRKKVEALTIENEKLKNGEPYR